MKLGRIKCVDLEIQLIQYQMRIVTKESVNATLDTSLQMPKIFVITVRTHMFGIVSKKYVNTDKMRMNQTLRVTLRVIVYLSFSVALTMNLR